MEKAEWTKTKGFRLPQKTLDQLDYLTSEGGIRTATEAVITAIDRLYTDKRTSDELLNIINEQGNDIKEVKQTLERIETKYIEARWEDADEVAGSKLKDDDVIYWAKSRKEKENHDKDSPTE